MPKKLIFALLFSFTSISNAATYGDVADEFWLGGSPWIQVRDTSYNKRITGSPVIAAYGVLMGSGTTFNINSTDPNSQYPGQGFLEVREIFALNLPGLGTLGHIAQLNKGCVSCPLTAGVVTSGGVRFIPVGSSAMAIIAARALVDDLPITYEENCAGTICNGFSWIQIEN